MKITRFFTLGTAGKRLTLTDPRAAVSGTCRACHGGQAMPDVDAKCQPCALRSGKRCQRVMARMDRKHPENNRFLQRPASLMHGGGCATVPFPRVHPAVNWIRVAAICGTKPVGVDIGCPQ